ncbi:hypothetical protein DRE_06444 [Drechslerella stenobrocha 248]|uniref:F-box domain-containing protein n=1 Tax=Drechslerella stenobrocha 248 TaxID=1043628 RepID=W7HLC3_9PEZI|nr:hypothetical protein DRE_06444 [Drechslerella stenobrocha 248]
MPSVALQQLPPEALRQIFGYFKHSKDIMRQLCLVSSTINGIVTPMLYETVILSFNRFRHCWKHTFPVDLFHSLCLPDNRGIQHVRNFGVKGNSKLWDIHWFTDDDLDTRNLLRNWRMVYWKMCSFAILTVMRRFHKNQLCSFIWNIDLACLDRHINDLLYREQRAMTRLWIPEKTPSHHGVRNNVYRNSLEDYYYHTHDLTKWHRTYPQKFMSFYVEMKAKQNGTIIPNPYSIRKVLEKEQVRRDAVSPDTLMRSLETVTKPQQVADPSNSHPHHLSLRSLRDDWTPAGFSLGHFWLGNLTTLKLYDCDTVNDTLGLLQGWARPKVFHFTSLMPNERLTGFLGSFDTLVELYLSVAFCNKVQGYIESICRHGQTLLTLHIRIRTHNGRLDGILSNRHLELLAENCKSIYQLALCLEPDTITEQTAQYLRGIKFLWTFTWPTCKGYTHLCNSLAILQSHSQVEGHRRFIAIGIRTEDGKEKPPIFEIHARDSVAGRAGNMLTYFTHWQMFEACPDLTLLNAATDWLPWEEYRDFVDSPDTFAYSHP